MTSWITIVRNGFPTIFEKGENGFGVPWKCATGLLVFCTIRLVDSAVFNLFSTFPRVSLRTQLCGIQEIFGYLDCMMYLRVEHFVPLDLPLNVISNLLISLQFRHTPVC